MAKLKVFAGYTYLAGVTGQQWAIVAATSQKAAAEALEISLYELRTYFAVTKNKTDCQVALSEPGVVFYCSMSDSISNKNSLKKWENSK